jgi:hypothetical protein
MALISARAYEPLLPGSKVQLHVIEALDHGQTLDEIDKVYGTMLAFT